jgi:iron complex outermembrane receptor protein
MGVSNSIKSRGSSLALAVALLAPNLAFAQDAPADEAAVEDNSEIVVTGSRMRGVAPVGSTVTTLSTADIAESGRVTLDRAIKELPQVFDLGVSENSRGQSGGSGNIVYGNSINLRGIGPNATLILVDGHRVVNNSRSTDPSVLPTLGVERVEIVADGASAIYGSDAVAGVVNLIPRRSLDGAEAFARAGVSDDGAYHEYALGAAFGKKWDRGQFMVAYEHVEKSNLNGFDRPFFTSDQRGAGGGDYRSTRCNPGTLRYGGNTYAFLPGGTLGAAGTANRCDDLQGQDLIPRQKYDSVNATFTYEFNDWLTFFADGFYSHRTFERINAFSNAALTLAAAPAGATPAVNLTNPYVLPLAGALGYVPGQALTVDYNFSGDLPRIVNYGYGISWQVTPGIRIKLPHDWQFEALFGIGKTDDNSIFDNGINNTALNAALRSTDLATAFDPTGLRRTSPAVLATIFNQISINPTIGNFKGYEARVNGPLFTLPGGQVKLAAGYEGQEWGVELGLARGNPGTPVAWRYFGRRVDSAYAELFVPLFGPDNAMGGFQKLELNAAVRYDKYSDVGSTTNPKFGVTWMPVDGLTIRGSYGTSFRAPTIPQIYGNSNGLFVQNYQNPGGGTITGVARSGGNLDLEPETATTWSVGADVEPLRNLRLSLTYFSVDYKNQVIALLSDLAVLTRESQYDGTGLIVRGANAQTIVQDLVAQGLPVTGALPANVTVYVDGRSQNLGRSITRGIDFTANYTLETDKAGTFGFNLSGTYLTSYRSQQTPTAPYIDQLNQIFQPLRFKMRAGVNWEKGPFSANIRWTHINGYLNTAVTPNQNVRSYNPIDVGIAFRVGEKDKAFVFGVDVRNIFDTAPPYVNIAPSVNGSGGYDATAADPVGRLVSFSVRKKI